MTAHTPCSEQKVRSFLNFPPCSATCSGVRRCHYPTTTGLYGASIVYNYIDVIQSPTEGRLTMSTRLVNFKATDDDRAVIERAAELAGATYSDVIRAGVRRVLGDLESGAVIDLTPNSATPQQ